MLKINNARRSFSRKNIPWSARPLFPSTPVSQKDAVWLVDAQPLSPSPSRQRNARRSSRGSGRPPSVSGCSDVPGLSSSSPMGERSPTLRPRSGSTGVLSTSGCSGFRHRVSRAWPTNLAVGAGRARLPRRSSTPWSSPGLIGARQGLRPRRKHDRGICGRGRLGWLALCGVCVWPSAVCVSPTTSAMPLPGEGARPEPFLPCQPHSWGRVGRHGIRGHTTYVAYKQ